MRGRAENILGGDIITEVDGIRIDSPDTAPDVVRNLEIGDTVALEPLRDDDAIE